MRARLQGAAATTVSPTRERRSSPAGPADRQPGSGNRGQGVTTRHETASSRNRPCCRPHPARDGSYPPTVGQVRLGPDHAEWPDGPQTRGDDSYTQRTTNLPGSLADGGGRPGAASGSPGRPGRWPRRPPRRARMRYGPGAASACTQVSGRPAAADRAKPDRGLVRIAVPVRRAEPAGAELSEAELSEAELSGARPDGVVRAVLCRGAGQASVWLTSDADGTAGTRTAGTRTGGTRTGGPGQMGRLPVGTAARRGGADGRTALADCRAGRNPSRPGHGRADDADHASSAGTGAVPGEPGPGP